MKVGAVLYGGTVVVRIENLEEKLFLEDRGGGGGVPVAGECRWLELFGWTTAGAIRHTEKSGALSNVEQRIVLVHMDKSRTGKR